MRRLLTRLRSSTVGDAGLHRPQLDPRKLDLVDFACTALGARSIADLGAVWKSDGGYCLHAIERHQVDPAIAVDAYPSDSLARVAANEPRLRLVLGHFGDPATAVNVGNVDAILLFDVLVAQAHPHWNEVIDLYAGQTNSFLVFNPQIERQCSFRLTDLSPDEYFRLVPVDRNQEPYLSAFAHLGEPHPDHPGRKWRDMFNLWQWAITDDDLTSLMLRHGFRLQFYRNYGTFGSSADFENHAFAFSRMTPRQ